MPGRDKYGSHCGQYSKYPEGFGINSVVWETVNDGARILGLTVLKLKVCSNEEAGVVSVYPPGGVTMHQLVAAE